MSTSLYQINARVWITELSKRLGRPATLDDVTDAELDAVAAHGFDWVWLLGVWQTGAAGRDVSRSRPEWRREFEETLPDLQESDIAGSCFAITDYHVHADLGGDEALARIRERLKQRGLRLMLDFVQNHTALDHPWATSHPDYYVGGSEEQLAAAPQNFIRLGSGGGSRIFAHGRDPYFDGWPHMLELKSTGAVQSRRDQSRADQFSRGGTPRGLPRGVVLAAIPRPRPSGDLRACHPWVA